MLTVLAYITIGIAYFFFLCVVAVLADEDWLVPLGMIISTTIIALWSIFS